MSEQTTKVAAELVKLGFNQEEATDLAGRFLKLYPRYDSEDYDADLIAEDIQSLGRIGLEQKERGW